MSTRVPVPSVLSVTSRMLASGGRLRDPALSQEMTRRFGGSSATYDMEKIARGLGAERCGKVAASGGYFGTMQLVADIEGRFRVPSGGGRPTDPAWTERRLLPLAPRTLKKLERIAAKVREDGINVEPMQLAALLNEKTAERLSEQEAEDLVRPKRRASR